MDSQVSDMPEEVSDHEIFDDPLLQPQQPDDRDSSFQTEMTGTAVPSSSRGNARSTTTPRGLKRPLLKEERHEVLHEALNHLKQLSQSEIEEDESAFGQVVSNDLRKMDEDNKICAQKIISEVLILVHPSFVYWFSISPALLLPLWGKPFTAKEGQPPPLTSSSSSSTPTGMT
ncbi:uncharacterized protein LOC135223193 [Macrobrachium nipponense]|uniref:uncharacterized protein LOC135223193 n=1 Tax=Macrobrachium nipponense TaxID=159736 RepID=UPI0030C8A21E